MSLDKTLVKAVHNFNEYELRWLLIYVSDLLDSPISAEIKGTGSDDSQVLTDVKVRSQKISFSESKCTKCPLGPYWYEYWREGGRARSRYLGKRLPEEYMR